MKRTESGTSFQEWHERNASIVVEENQQLNMEVDMFFDSKEDPIITDNAFYNDDDVMTDYFSRSYYTSIELHK